MVVDIAHSEAETMTSGELFFPLRPQYMYHRYIWYNFEQQATRPSITFFFNPSHGPRVKNLKHRILTYPNLRYYYQVVSLRLYMHHGSRSLQLTTFWSL